jgi:hypothetical protein
MDVFQKIAEERIKEAMGRGEFDNLPSSGKPLKLDQDAWLPEDLRMACKVLKNAGCVPPELDLRKEILCLRELIDTIDDDKERLKKIRQLNFNILKLNTMRKKPIYLEDLPEYEVKVISRYTDTACD